MCGGKPLERLVTRLPIFPPFYPPPLGSDEQ
jgi:hypothetical protein